MQLGCQVIYIEKPFFFADEMYQFYTDLPLVNISAEVEYMNFNA